MHHGDFDEAGVQILRDLEPRYGAVPWRFDVAVAAQAIAHVTRPRPRDPDATTLEAGSGGAPQRHP